MAIPPFPSQDLAKLVLGYLAEEQLMTAYDEFLQASPYLDALRNEYDRIFMTSLKNILAEYRAMKIYVETCKPFVLRRRLFQCTNLFEIVKLLVQNVDINKLNSEEQNGDKTSSNPSVSCNPSISQIEATSLGSSVETTSLADLPGNTTTKKRTLKSFDRDHSNAQNITHSVIDPKQVTTCSNGLNGENPVPQSVNEEGQNYIAQKSVDPPEDGMMKNEKVESAQKSDEFDNILDFVCKTSNDTSTRNVTAADTTVGHKQRISTAGTFQDFTTGIYNDNKSDPSVSTSAEVINAQAPLRRNVNNTYINIGTINAANLKPKSPYMLKVGCIKNNQGIPVITTELTSQVDHKSAIHNSSLTREENKIKILSDIKVDKCYENICPRPKVTPLMKNATSTPHIQMSTILVNGTPAYRPKPPTNYTVDEIMAMPFFVMPPTEPNSSSTQTQPRITLPTLNTTLTATTSCAQNILKPLVIDVTSNINVPDINCEKRPKAKIDQKLINEQSLVKTVEVTGHVSVPKDNSLLTALRTSTPQGLPPKRKSSSTPRRTSHVRVLDFTTPRRILHETINEQSSNKSSSVEGENKDSADQPNKEAADVDKSNTLLEKVTHTSSSNAKSEAAKENKVIPIKKNNWDADLRALVATDIDQSNTHIQRTKSKTRSTNCKKKNTDNKDSDKAKEEKTKSEKKAKKTSSKLKDNKNKKPKDIDKEVEDATCINKVTSTVAIKPNINIITSNEWSTNQENDKSQSKDNVSKERIDTPESERISLQNAIGAKLNLSDLLETPYKQALYDIQMDTPKYLGPDLPDEPISDVKIMSIPTPRFLCSPKEVLTTPSSYSSRLTDYSGSASYYNPDYQGNVATEIFEEPLDTRANVKLSEKSDKSLKKHESNTKIEEPKSRRPVRQCRKNVSYFNNANNTKTKELEDDDKLNNSINMDSSLEKSDNSINLKKVRDSRRKSESIKKNVSLKKTKSPKTFMKIKPRRTTPAKENLCGKPKPSKKHSESTQTKSQKKTSSKENSNLIPVAASIPTKSRRKSSTPRKIHCTKSFNSQPSGNISPESVKSKESLVQDSQVCSQDSDIEQLPLRWSDDGSQDGKSQEVQLKLESESVNDGDDITKIKKYIETSVSEKVAPSSEGEGSLHIDLIKRGFDIETAKIIERDLLDSPQSKLETNTNVVDLERIDVKNNVLVEENSIRTSDTSVNLEIVDTDDDNDEVEFSIYECNEDTANFINYEYVEVSPSTKPQLATLKDKFSMEICIDDELTVRLRATTFNTLLDQDPNELDTGCSYKETEIAVNSISHIDKLYTPMKDAKQEIYNIFESTLTSIDTPFKAPSPKSQDSEPIVTEVELEVEKLDYKEKLDVKKRKRIQSSSTPEGSPNSTKRPKSDTQYLLNTANIQNIDIESVLSKLHGP